MSEARPSRQKPQRSNVFFSFSSTKCQRTDFSSPIVHQIDTRQNNTFTVFDGSRDDENKLAKQFWNSVLLMPPVESTLVCKEIKQKTKHRPLHEKPRSKILPQNLFFDRTFSSAFFSQISAERRENKTRKVDER